MKMLYTANGRYIRCCTAEGTRPVIIVCEKEYEVDVQEFMVWSILNWRILREEEIGSYYEKMANHTNVTIHRSWQDCVQRLYCRFSSSRSWRASLGKLPAACSTLIPAASARKKSSVLPGRLLSPARRSSSALRWTSAA